jgi:CRISPR system Cascade subunit CasA
MNLLTESWLPVRRRDGSREWIAPDRLSEPDITAFDADRPDFNGALAQFAIGLLQTATSVDSASAWRKCFSTPPDAEALRRWYAPVVEAFEFDGDGARFMQDLSLRPDEGAINDIDALLIESPGEQTQKNNSDHFVKRGQIAALCPHCAVTALLTLQINAPSGGAGHRTGLRGGGPLTTLILAEPHQSLWHHLWLNVRERPVFLAQGGDTAKTEGNFSFPWLSVIATIQREGRETAPIQVHPAHVYWAMPRRIRLDLDTVLAGDCGICGRPSERLIRQYVTKTYGLNYKGAWDHPLSPYYETKEGWLPLHPQPGGFGYRHWLAWVLGLSTDKKRQRPARVVEYFLEHRRRLASGQLRLWAFGYDMANNMKARCWYESTLPLYGLADCEREAQRRVEAYAKDWLSGAETAVFFLRSAVKDAWFSTDRRGDFSAIDATFWSRTEPDFYRHLKNLIEVVREDRDFDATQVRNSWHRLLIRTVVGLFDEEFVGAGPVERQNPHRVATAYQRLGRNLQGPTMRRALGLPLLASTSRDKQPAANAA